LKSGEKADINDFGKNMTLHKIDPDGINRIVIKRGDTGYGLLLVEIFDKNNSSALKIGSDEYTPFEVKIQPKERIVGIAAGLSDRKQFYDL
jgi:hypothetical protein